MIIALKIIAFILMLVAVPLAFISISLSLYVVISLIWEMIFGDDRNDGDWGNGSHIT